MTSASQSPTAPVAVMMFNRPDSTKRVIQAVLNTRPRAVYLIADGPRPDHPYDVDSCERVRQIATEPEWSCPVHTLFAPTNMGLKNRFVSGLDWLFDHEDQAIILEDDCVPDPSFFRYCTELLERYHNDERVGMISGNNFLRGETVSDDSYFFSTDPRIWGWATWSRVWLEARDVSMDKEWRAEEVINASRSLSSLSRQRAMRSMAKSIESLDAWDVPFVLHLLSGGYVNAIPRVNLVTNVGFGAQSTHTKFESFTADVPSGHLDFPLHHPKQVADVPEAGVLEDRVERRQWLTFPLKHPVDFAGRVLRYLRATRS